jgi:hypothetical protein
MKRLEPMDNLRELIYEIESTESDGDITQEWAQKLDKIEKDLREVFASLVECIVLMHMKGPKS